MDKQFIDRHRSVQDRCIEERHAALCIGATLDSLIEGQKADAVAAKRLAERKVASR